VQPDALAETLVAIIKEDHREVLSVLHAFRDALIDGTIIDGLIRSTIVSLKSHIRKEDNEFFELVDKHLSTDVCASLIEGMNKIEAEFVPAEPGDRIKLTAERRASAANRAHIDDAFQALRETMLDSCNCH
jgi:hemerythrin-like domain-containing protein